MFTWRLNSKDIRYRGIKKPNTGVAQSPASSQIHLNYYVLMDEGVVGTITYIYPNVSYDWIR